MFVTDRWEDDTQRYDREKEEEAVSREVAGEIEKDKKWQADREATKAEQEAEKKRKDEERNRFARSKPAEYRSVSGRWVAPGQEMEYYDKPTRSMEEI